MPAREGAVLRSWWSGAARLAALGWGFVLFLSGCTGSAPTGPPPPTHLVGGTVSGLSGSGLVLDLSGEQQLSIAADGSFAFPDWLTEGSDYAISVSAQPAAPKQTCAITNSTGTMDTTSVTNVQVTCVTNKYTVSGSVTGLSGSGLILHNNGGDAVPVTGSGTIPFQFATALDDLSTFDVTVSAQPTSLSQTCLVSNGSGDLSGADITNVQVNCTTNSYAVRAVVSNVQGSGLVLRNNGGDNLSAPSSNVFTFSAALLDGATYSVSILSHPTNLNQTCSITGATGTIQGANATVGVACQTNTYTVGGTVTGLAGSGLTLQNNAGDDVVIVGSGTVDFTFPTTLADGSSFAVTVAQQPGNLTQTCTVSTGVGTLAGSNYTGVQVTCVTKTYTVGGTVSGLNGSGLTLRLNGGSNLSIFSSGGFAFPGALVDGSSYSVTVFTQPTSLSQTCSVSSGSGTLSGGNITTVQVTCITDKFTIGGTVTGLAGSGLVLQMNNANNLSVSGSSFTFTSPFNDGTNYTVAVYAHPSSLDQICTVTGGGTGTLSGANVNNVQVTCVTQQYQIGGTVTGLAGSGLVLQNNGGDNKTILSNGAFFFSTKVTDGDPYDVTVLTQPTTLNQICSVSNGSGNVAGNNISNVQVSCVTNQYTVGGTVTGLAGSGLTLRINGTEDVVISQSGPYGFTFPTSLADGTYYSVTVPQQPTGLSQSCNITNPNGNIAGANVTNVQVSCTTNYFSIGGTVTNLQGSGLVLQNNGGDDKIVTGTGDVPFTFATTQIDGSDYDVTIIMDPSNLNQTCSVTGGGSGTISSTNVTSVAITCVTIQYTVSGAVNGLAGSGLTLQNNGGDTQGVPAGGPYSFTFTAQDDGTDYDVTVSAQPTGPLQLCLVTSGAGTISGMDVPGVTLDCYSAYSVSVNVTGLTGTGLVLQNNGGDDLPASSNTTYTFATSLLDNDPYDVTVLTYPSSPFQYCAITNGNGNIPTANVTNVGVDCNIPPTGSITAPLTNQTINTGGSVNFTSSCSDTDDDTPFTHDWDFDGGATNSTAQDPGSVTFNTPGVYTVTYYCTDARSLTDLTPPAVQITVNAAPDGVIDVPAADQIVGMGGAVYFQATCTDPDGNSPFTHSWNFDGGATNSTAEDPGDVTFSTPGTYNVTYTCTDALGFADPTPAGITVTVDALGPGSLDPTFDTDGKVTTNFNVFAYNDLAAALAIDDNGKIVVAGTSMTGTWYDFALSRYNVDGSLDTSFDIDGKLTTSVGTMDDIAGAIAIQNDGKIIAAGHTGLLLDSTTYDIGLVRYNVDGSLDTTFDIDGKVTTAVSAGMDSANAVQLQNDGKIVVGGRAWNGTDSDFAILRYNSDGSLDTTFDSDGIILTDFGSGDDNAYDLQIQNDGKLVLVGETWNGSDWDFALARYNANGSLDTSFNSIGTVTTPISASEDDRGWRLTIQNDGKMVVVGISEGINTDIALVRYNPDGSLDTTFNSDGKLTTDINSTDYGTFVTTQPDGKIIVAGCEDCNSGGSEFAILRYNIDGSLDSSFDSDGIVTTDYNNGNDSAQAIGLQKDGRIVVAGYSFPTGTADFALALYLP